MSRQLFDSLNEVGERIAQSPHLLLCLDFDGTLTPLADNPAAVCLSTESRRLLRLLAEQDNVSVAIVSGRKFTDLQERVEVPGVIYAGNHGLEIYGPGLHFVEPTAELFREALAELAADLTERLKGVPEAWVENKGLTLSVHYRRVPEEQWDEVRRIVHVALSNASHPFLLHLGNKVFEIQPRVYWNKGNAVTWLQQHLGEDNLLTIYVGDDVSDEEAFSSISDGVTVKVGDAPESVALFQLGGPEEVHAFLKWIFNCVRESQRQLTH